VTDLAVLAIQIDSAGAKKGAAEAVAATKTIRDAAKETEDATKSLNKVLGAIGGVLALRKIVAVGKEVLLLGARYETLGIAVAAAGTNVGRSQLELKALQKELQATGISMIEARQNILRMVQANIDLSKSTDLARIAQNAAVIANTNSSEAFNRLVHGLATGHVLVLRNLGLVVNFENAYERMAEQLHTTTENLTEAERQTARLNEVQRAGANIAGVYTAAMATAGKQLGSTVRFLEDAKVKASEAFQPSFTAAVFAYAKALKVAGEHAEAVGAGLLFLGSAGVLTAIYAVGAAFVALNIAIAPVVTALGIIAALAGTGALAWYRYATATKEARLELDKFTDSVGKTTLAELAKLLVTNRVEARKLEEELKSRPAEGMALQQLRRQGLAGLGPPGKDIATTREALEKLNDEYGILQLRLIEIDRLRLAGLAKDAADAEAAAAKLAAALEEAKKQAKQLLQDMVAVAEVAGDPVLQAYAAQLKLLGDLHDIASRLPPIFAEALAEGIKKASIELQRLEGIITTPRFERALQALALGGLRPTTKTTSDFLTTPGGVGSPLNLRAATDLPKYLTNLDGSLVQVNVALSEATQATLELIQTQERYRLAAIDLAVDVGILPDALGKAASSLVRMIATMQQLKAAGKDTTDTLVLGLAQMVASLVPGKSAVANTARGGIGGAAAGFAVRGPVGAVVGGVLGVASGLFGGDGGQRKKDIEALTEAIKRFAEQARHLTPLQQTLDNLTKEFNALYAEAKRLGEPTRQIAANYARQVQEAKDAFAQQEFAFQKGLEVRRLELEGTEAEAATAALALRQAEQIAEAAKQGYGAATTAVLQHVHALEKEKLALDQAVAAIQQKSEAEQFLGDLEARELALVGDKAGAARKRLENQALAAQREAEALFTAGTITEDIFDRLTGVINGELNVALEELGTTVDETGKQINAFVARAREDLEVRRLVALGLTEEAAARQVVLDQQREINTLIEQGADEATLALAKYVQSLEATAAWIDRVTAAEEKRLRVLELTARKEEDLAVRELRALGRTAGADELAQIQRNAAELRDALEQGLGQAVIDNILRVQGIERGAADAARRAAQEEAFLKGSTSLGGGLEAESRTSFNAAVGITESQANRLAGLMQTQVVYQSNLPDMRAALRELVQLARIGRGLVGSDLDIEAIDAALEGRSSSADRAAGLPPGNV
jgi:hypothetical protein